MLADIQSMLLEIVTASVGWLDSILEAVGVWPLVLAVFAIIMAMNLLRPLLGGGASDTVKKKKGDKE